MIDPWLTLFSSCEQPLSSSPYFDFIQIKNSIKDIRQQPQKQQ